MRIPGLELAVDDSALPWRASSVRGVAWLPLASAGRGAETTALIRMEPGHGYPAHRHLDVEEVLVLAGGYRDAEGEHPSGAYLRYAAGSEHAPVALGDPTRPAGPDNPACLLFASARGGVQILEPRE